MRAERSKLRKQALKERKRKEMGFGKTHREERGEARRERRKRQPAATLWWAQRKNWRVQLPNGGAAGRSPWGLVLAPSPGAAPRLSKLGGVVGAELPPTGCPQLVSGARAGVGGGGGELAGAAV